MTDKGVSVFISERATQAMISHAAFLAAVNESAARRLMEEFGKTASSLSQLPYRGKRLEGKMNILSDYRYLIFGKYYLLIYVVEDDGVHVDHVIDGRRDHRLLFQML